MSVERRCPNCFSKEKMRLNFGGDYKAEIEFHSQAWCSCPYKSPEEMMIDQDMGLTDPTWLQIAESFIDDYRMLSKEIKSKEEDIRVFLKLLNFHTKNYSKSLELIKTDNAELPKFVKDGKPEKPVKFNLFK